MSIVITGADLGARVRSLRKERGWSAQRLSDIVCDLAPGATSRNVIASAELGRKDAVTLAEAFAFAAAFGMTIVEFIDPDGDVVTCEFERGYLKGRLDALRAIASLAPTRTDSSVARVDARTAGIGIPDVERHVEPRNAVNVRLRVSVDGTEIPLEPDDGGSNGSDHVEGGGQPS